MRNTNDSMEGATDSLNLHAARAASLTAPNRWILLASLVVWSFAAYLVIVLPVDRLLPAINRWQVAGPLSLVSCVLACIAMRRVAVRTAMSGERLKDITLFFVMLLFCSLAVDAGFTAYTHLDSEFRIDQRRLFQQRHYDSRVWDGELMPVTYYPTDANFWLYKPEQMRTATAYGEHYYTALSRHAVLKDSVLETRRIEFSIDRYGLRNVDDPARAAVFTLGDSFCFGHHVTQHATFSQLLKDRLGEPVYNAGVSGTSPRQQLLLFEHLLRTHPETFKPKRLLWLIFEGNDLTGSYDTKRPGQAGSRSLGAIFSGTIVGAVADIPALLRGQSVIRLVSSGQTVLTGRMARQTTGNHYELDGEALAYPVYRSSKFGYAIFREEYLEQAAQSRSDVLNHPNLPRLVDTFRQMRALAEKRGFAVTVVMVPTNVRLYKDYFEDLPPISDQPHFSNFVKELAGELGFAHVDLGELLAPYAANEFIYYRDDTHWNERGHQLVADLLAQRLTSTTAMAGRARAGFGNRARSNSGS
jgi:hypothetical protein